MLYQLLYYWVYMTGVLFAAGFLAIRILSMFTQKQIVDYSIDQPIFAGIAVLTTVVCTFNFFVEISPDIHIIIVGSLLSYLILDHRAVFEYIIKRFFDESVYHFSNAEIIEDSDSKKITQSFRTIACLIVFVILSMFAFIYIGPEKEEIDRHRIHVEIRAAKSTVFKIYYDRGRGIREADSVGRRFLPNNGFSTLQFTIPSYIINSLRFDPVTISGEVGIRSITINGHRLSGESLLDALNPVHHVENLEARGDIIYFRSSGRDPIFYLKRPITDFPTGSKKKLNITFFMSLISACAVSMIISNYLGTLRFRLSRLWKRLLYCSKMSLRAFFMVRQKWMLFSSLIAIVGFATYVSLHAFGYETEYDTALYHAQAVKWVKEYPVIPGLANVESRLGFNNSSFLLCAFFDFGVVEHKVFHAVNPGIYLFTLIFLLYTTLALFKKKWNLSNIFAAIVLWLIFIQGLAGAINSLSTDSISRMLTIYIFIYALRYLESSTRKIEDVFFLLIMTVSAATVKLINISMIILPFLFVLEWVITRLKPLGRRAVTFLHAEARIVCIFSALLVIFFLPWLVRNVLISGYLIYPMYQIDLFPVDWKLPIKEAKNEMVWIKSSARNPGVNPKQVLGKGFHHWFRRWEHKSVLRNMLLIPLGIHFSTALFFFDHYKNFLLRYWQIYAGIFFCVIYWFLVAPDPRIGYGFLIVSAAFLLSLFVEGIFKISKDRIRYSTVMVFILILSLHAATEILNTVNMDNFLKKELMPYRPRKPYQYMSRHGVNIYVSAQAGYILPAAQTPRPYLEMRGADYADGFRSRKP